jgi:hypothetical protein
MARVPSSESTRKRIAELPGGEFEKSELMREGPPDRRRNAIREPVSRFEFPAIRQTDPLRVATIAGNETSVQ